MLCAWVLIQSVALCLHVLRSLPLCFSVTLYCTLSKKKKKKKPEKALPPKILKTAVSATRFMICTKTKIHIQLNPLNSNSNHFSFIQIAANNNNSHLMVVYTVRQRPQSENSNQHLAIAGRKNSLLMRRKHHHNQAQRGAPICCDQRPMTSGH